MRDRMRRHAPSAFRQKPLQSGYHQRSRQKTRRRHDAPVGEGHRLQAVVGDGLIDRGQADHRLFVGMLQKVGGQFGEAGRTGLAAQLGYRRQRHLKAGVGDQIATDGAKPVRRMLVSRVHTTRILSITRSSLKEPLPRGGGVGQPIPDPSCKNW